MLSVLLATVSARCVSVREGSDLGLEHEDAGCSRGDYRAGGSHPSRRGGGLARCTGGGVASSAAAALRGAVRFRRGTFYGRKCRCRGTARARGGRLLARRGHVVRRVACPDKVLTLTLTFTLIPSLNLNLIRCAALRTEASTGRQ